METNNPKKSDLTINQNGLNVKNSIQLGKNVTASNDSGIHEDGLDNNSQNDVPINVGKTNSDEFQLPSWLANGEPIPDELLAKRSFATHSNEDNSNDDDDDEDFDPYQPSSFYAFSFIDLSGSSEDTWSVRSAGLPSTTNVNIRDEIKTCVETLNSCLTQFREMNEQFHQNQTEIIDEDVRKTIDDMLDQIENVSVVIEISNATKHDDVLLDSNLLNELITKKLNLQEYLSLLDRLIDNKILQLSSKSADELSSEIISLAEEIEHYRMMINNSEHTSDVEQHFFQRSLDNPYHNPFLANTQSNYSVLSFLQTSTSMDMSLLATNDLSSQIQSTLFTSTIQQQQNSANGGKPADLGTGIFFS